MRIGESVRHDDVFVIQSFTAYLVAKLVTRAGVDRVLTVDLHVGQIQGSFDIPLDEMSAMFSTARYLGEKRSQDAVVGSPGLGNTTQARNVASVRKCPLVIIEKRRRGNDGGAEMSNLIRSM